ncbi:MAG: hypothetical protein NC421_07335 [Lachnospiraceae bacterium]|nr:hypothetical protein [Lachnospiraceae bacterium]
MTLIELFNRFWSLNRYIPFKSLDCQVYMYLISQCNKQYWNNPFQLPQRIVERELDLKRDAIDKAKNRLQQRGLIRIKKGKGSAAPWVEIVGVKCTSKSLKDEFCVDIWDTNDDTNEDTNEDTNPTQNENPHYNIKDNKTKRQKDSLSMPLGKPVEGVLDLKFDEPKKKKTKSRTPQESPPAPTIEEVKAHFLSQSADTRLDDWEAEAEIFFNNFDATDWVDASGRKIKRWDSRANRWILEKEQRKKSSQTNGKFRQQTQISADRRGTEADGKPQKNWDASF